MSEQDKPRLIVVVGPTASGKTELALRIAEALGGEIVNADSIQVYRHFEIGTAKPSAAERARVPHHLLDFADPNLPLDAAQWCQLADASIARLTARNVTPVVCGGTFLWVKALLYGLAKAPPGDASLRERHRQLAHSQGREALHQELARVDPQSAARLNPNDLVRVSRALEVFELTGEPLSLLHERHGFQEPRYRARLIGVAQDRATGEARMRERTRRMFEAGWVDEVRGLLERGYGESRPMRSVGYRQIAGALMAGEEPLDLAELEDSVYRATRVFARRQRTWLRDQPAHWLSAELAQPNADPAAVLEALERADEL